MSMYYCCECNQLLDGDYFPCVEHPVDPCATVCETCADDIQNDIDMQKELEQMRRDNQREVEAGLKR